MNRKGFMMAEVVVVSSIVLVTLVTLYVSYNKMISIYNQRINYYDIVALYDLAFIRNNIIDDSVFVSKTLVYNETNKKVYFVDYHDLSELKADVENQTFKDYLDYIDSSVEFDTDYIYVMESCPGGDIDNCKYAYLEVLANGEES